MDFKAKLARRRTLRLDKKWWKRSHWLSSLLNIGGLEVRSEASLVDRSLDRPAGGLEVMSEASLEGLSLERSEDGLELRSETLEVLRIALWIDLQRYKRLATSSGWYLSR